MTSAGTRESRCGARQVSPKFSSLARLGRGAARAHGNEQGRALGLTRRHSIPVQPADESSGHVAPNGRERVPDSSQRAALSWGVVSASGAAAAHNRLARVGPDRAVATAATAATEPNEAEQRESARVLPQCVAARSQRPPPSAARRTSWLQWSEVAPAARAPRVRPKVDDCKRSCCAS